MTQTDIEYKALVERILSEGVTKMDRTGTGTMQVFGHMGRYDCKNNRLPLLTTKRVHFKSVLHELLWFLKGDTNIQYLCKNGVTIWDEWPYKKYMEAIKKDLENNAVNMSEVNMSEINPSSMDALDVYCHPFTLKEFAKHVAEDDIFARKYGDIGRVYGKLWVEWLAVTGSVPNIGANETQYTWIPVVTVINQLKNAIDILKSNPDSRRNLVTAWYPGQVEKACLPPCHVMYQFDSTVMSTRERCEMFIDYCNMNGIFVSSDFDEQMRFYAYPERKLSILFNMRSVDCLLGYCFDIASYGILLAAVAKYTNHVTSQVIISSADTHLYLNHIDAAEEQMTREGYDRQPWLKINASDSSDIFNLKYEDFELIDYQHDAPIKAKVAV